MAPMQFYELSLAFPRNEIVCTTVGATVQRTRPGSRQAPRSDTMLAWRSVHISCASHANARSRRASVTLRCFTATRPCQRHRPR